MKILINNQEQENIKAIQVNDYFVIVNIQLPTKNLTNKNVYSYRYKNVIKFGQVENSYYNECNEIIATIKRRIDSTIPLIIFKEQSVEELANIGSYHDKKSDDLYKEGFVEGYNLAKSSDKKYTERDIINAVETLSTGFYSNGDRCCLSINEYIESLNQPKLPDVINLEMKMSKDYVDDQDAYGYDIYKLKTTSTSEGEIIEITI